MPWTKRDEGAEDAKIGIWRYNNPSQDASYDEGWVAERNRQEQQQREEELRKAADEEARKERGY